LFIFHILAKNKQMNQEPYIKVGIMSELSIEFELNSSYQLLENEQVYFGKQTVNFTNKGIEFDGFYYDKLHFVPFIYDNSSFILNGVTIGVQFHWQQKENQTFKGELDFIREGNKLCAINKLKVEDYLTSVISSEMSATASLELLKAHAVISRSWLLANINKKTINTKDCCTQTAENELIKWYERTDHTNFDVCADDHCQRYQGIQRITNPNVKTAIFETKGEVLVYGEKICDARFSKSCGGVSELFESCWADVHHNYLEPIVDFKGATLPDLSIEENAIEWIKQSPKAYCNSRDKKILSQVLNHYDQTTTDFYRWTVTYSQTEISEIIQKRSGIDFGEIEALIPILRGPSGRLIKLKIVGTKKTMIVGKELEIRKWLSNTHLYSSAFYVEKNGNNFILHGAGWGHGVGLCQIGAAVMGEKGFNYQEILSHYYKNSELKKIY